MSLARAARAQTPEPELTIFACPKPFTDPHIARIQRNAIRSWTRLVPPTRVLVLGRETGVSEVCQEFGMVHVPDIERNEYGTPLIDSVFARAERHAPTAILAYVNADMILMSDFARAVERVGRVGRPFLLSGGRWDLDVTEDVTMSGAAWETRLRAQCRDRGRYSFWGNDYFVFARGSLGPPPAMAVGRGWFDGWLFWRARDRGNMVVDASDVVMAIHQTHTYDPGLAGSPFESPEGHRNFALGAQERYWFLLEATHRLTRAGLCRVYARKLRYQIREVIGHGRARLGRLRRRLLGGAPRTVGAAPPPRP